MHKTILRYILNFMPTHHYAMNVNQLRLTTEPSPRVKLLKNFITVLSILSPFTNIPQLIEVYQARSGDLSLLSWSLYVVFTIPFIIYGIIDRDRMVLINSCINLILLSTILVGILLYR